MLRVFAQHYVSIGQALAQLSPLVRGVEVFPAQSLTAEQRQWVVQYLVTVQTHCDQLELPVSSQFLDHYIDLFSEAATFPQVQSCVDNFEITFGAELKERLFLFVPPDHASLFEREALFGNEVNAAFPSASKDVRSAGTCLALGLSTACVFHSMRALEPALRSLAEAVSETFSVEQWHVVINRIESKIEALRESSKSPQRDANLEFYSTAAKEFRYFKDAWRNHVMHARGTYDDADAIKILEHVGDFMRHLSERLRENT